MILRPRQVEFVNKSVKALKKHDNTLSVAATGFGKTVALSTITERVINCEKRALVVQHRDELTTQNADTYKAISPGTSLSFFNAKKKSWRGQVVFSMIQTLSQPQHLERMPPVDLVVYDEAHHSASNSYQRLTARAKKLNPKVKILGVTATPERSDSRGLKDTFSNVADIVTISEMVRAGHLVPPRGMVIDIGTQEDLQRVRKTANDYNMAEVEAIMNKDVHHNKIVEHWAANATDRPTVAFTSTVQHACDTRDAFRDAGYTSEAVSGDTPKRERRNILERFSRGDIQVLTNPMLLTEGWDCQICSCVVLLRTSSHKSTMIQMVGRGLRKVDPRRHPGFNKKDCLVMDFGISLLNHGDLNADVKLKHSRGDDGETEKRVKNCPDCKAEMPIQTRECPLCGYEFKVELDEDGFYDELKEFRMIEIDLISKSPFKWVSVFSSDKVLITSGFNSWSAVVSPDGDSWFAIGGGQGKKTDVLGVANKIGAIGTADDFMRQNETSRSAKKAAKWMCDPASAKQAQILNRFGYSGGIMSKVEAAAHLTFRFNQNMIEKLIGVTR